MFNRTLYPEDLTPPVQKLCLVLRRNAIVSTPTGWRVKGDGKKVHAASLAKLFGEQLAIPIPAANGKPTMAALTAAGIAMAKRLIDRQAQRAS